jgi:hypothetical protein
VGDEKEEEARRNWKHLVAALGSAVKGIKSFTGAMLTFIIV